MIEMEHMLDEYLDFARGEGGEDAQSADLGGIRARKPCRAARRGRRNGRLRIGRHSRP